MLLITKGRLIHQTDLASAALTRFYYCRYPAELILVHGHHTAASPDPPDVIPVSPTSVLNGCKRAASIGNVTTVIVLSDGKVSSSKQII